MTAPVEIAASIEHLDPQVAYQGSAHGRAFRRADFWVNQHGCAELLLCGSCLERNYAILQEWLNKGKSLHCAMCGLDAWSIDATITEVVPL